MLSNAQEKLIKQLHHKKGREKNQLCLLEGEKVIDQAGEFIKFTFDQSETDKFADLVTTSSLPDVAAVAKIPKHSWKDILSKDTVIITDTIQDPGNMGSIIRLCLAFDASLILHNSVDITNTKVIRSSVGSFFQLPWKTANQEELERFIEENQSSIYRIEKTEKAKALTETKFPEKRILILGSEGKGIQTEIEGESIYIEHAEELESLNATHALAITLHQIYNQN